MGFYKDGKTEFCFFLYELIGGKLHVFVIIYVLCTRGRYCTRTKFRLISENIRFKVPRFSKKKKKDVQ